MRQENKYTINTSDLPEHIITSKDVLFYTSDIQLEVLICGTLQECQEILFFISVYKSFTFKEIPIPSQICLSIFHLKVCKKSL